MKNQWVYLKFPDEETFGLVRKDYWEENECLSDTHTISEIEEEGIYLDGFFECMESIYEYERGTYQEGEEVLKKLGFIEVENPF